MVFKIGILGGIGPESTGIFYLKLIRKLQEKGLIKSNLDFPQIIINSIPAPELIFDKISNKDLEMYVKGIKELDALNPNFIVMVCNTIHLFYDELQSEIKCELIDLRKEVLNALENKNITIIGTPSTICLGLYDFEGIKYYNPNKDEMKILTNAIFNFNQGIEKEKQRQKVLEIINKYLSCGSEIILLACTEFAAMFEDVDIPKINTIDVLVNAVVRRYSQK